MLLEPLPPAVQAAMDRHNSEALRLFVDYVRCYVRSLPPQLQAAQGAHAAVALPLSGVRLPAGPAAAGSPGSQEEQQEALWDSCSSSSSGATPAEAAPASLKQLLEEQRVHYQVGACLAWPGLAWPSLP